MISRPSGTTSRGLFQCDENGIYAVSLDASGADLPRGPCAEGWHFKVAFRLGVHEPVPEQRVHRAKQSPAATIQEPLNESRHSLNYGTRVGILQGRVACRPTRACL